MPSEFNLALLVSSLESASNRSDLIEFAQQIQHAQHHWQREIAGKVVRRKLDEFKKR